MMCGTDYCGYSKGSYVVLLMGCVFSSLSLFPAESSQKILEQKESENIKLLSGKDWGACHFIGTGVGMECVGMEWSCSNCWCACFQKDVSSC